MKAYFCAFFGYFHGCEQFFTGSFSKNFTGRLKFSRVLFEVFSRVEVDFHGKKIDNFSREGYFFHGLIFLLFLRFLLNIPSPRGLF